MCACSRLTYYRNVVKKCEQCDISRDPYVEARPKLVVKLKRCLFDRPWVCAAGDAT